MNKLFHLSAASAVLLSFHALPASAQAQTVEQLHTDLQVAVCLNDWSDAVAATSGLIASSEVAAESRAELVNFRRQLQDWQATNAEVSNIAGCESVEVEVPVQPSQQASQRLNWNRAAESIGARGVVGQATARPAARPVATVPIAGDTCDDFATQGEAQWHYFIGTAPAALDDDRDLVACEWLSVLPRESGSRTWSNNFNGMTVSLMRVATTDYYLRVEDSGLPEFTTRSFSSGEEALEHAALYYQPYQPRQN